MNRVAIVWTLICTSAGFFAGWFGKREPTRKELVSYDRETFASSSYAGTVTWMRTSETTRRDRVVVTRWLPGEVVREERDRYDHHQATDTGAATVQRDELLQDVQRLRRETTVTARPAWRVGPVVLIQDGKVSYGAAVERRILGPVSVGVAATTARAFMITATVEF